MVKIPQTTESAFLQKDNFLKRKNVYKKDIALISLSEDFCFHYYYYYFYCYLQKMKRTTMKTTAETKQKRQKQ